MFNAPLVVALTLPQSLTLKGHTMKVKLPDYVTVETVGQSPLDEGACHYCGTPLMDGDTVYYDEAAGLDFCSPQHWQADQGQGAQS